MQNLTKIIFILLCCCVSAGRCYAEPVQTSKAVVSDDIGDGAEELAPGQSAGEVQEAEQKKKAGFKSWKRKLPFWPRKGFILAELMVYITIGVLLAQILEVLGVIKYLAILAWPVIRMGKLGQASGPAFLMAFQSGAVANSMLISSRDRGDLNNRQLYTSVLVVSCLSLFAHLPTYVIPIGSVFGAEATAMLFGVRFAAIITEIIVILVVSNLLVRPWYDKRYIAAIGSAEAQAERTPRKTGKFWPTVWKRSRRTLRRLLIFLVPTFAIMVTAEYYGFFDWLSDKLPSLFKLSFLPAESTVIIPAQAMSLYNGAIAAANFIEDGSISAKQAVLIILIGSLITAPIRTFKHALPTYVAVLGPKAGTIMAISAQVLRSIFLIIFIILMWYVWA